MARLLEPALAPQPKVNQIANASRACLSHNEFHGPGDVWGRAIALLLPEPDTGCRKLAGKSGKMGPLESAEHSLMSLNFGGGRNIQYECGCKMCAPFHSSVLHVNQIIITLFNWEVGIISKNDSSNFMAGNHLEI